MTVGFRDQDYAGLADVVEAYRADFAAVSRAQREGLEALGPAPSLAAVVQRVQGGDLLRDLERVASQRDLGGYLEERARRMRRFAEEGMGYDAMVAGQVALLLPLERAVAERFAGEPGRAARALDALRRLRAAVLVVAGRVFADLRAEALERQYRQALRELSTPVIPIWEGILLVPLVGALDGARARQLVEQLLERAVATQSRVAILDVTGVPAVDTQVAGYLLQAARAVRLVGATALLVGMGPQVAQALARLGVDLGGLETYLDLRSGLQRALGLLGFALVRRAGGEGPGPGPGGGGGAA